MLGRRRLFSKPSSVPTSIRPFDSGSDERRPRSAAAVLILLGCLGRPLPAAWAAGVGDVVPPLPTRTAGGKEFRLEAELRDHPVLLAFVSARCKPCEESEPALEKVSRDFGARHQLGLISVYLGQTGSTRPGALPNSAVPAWADEVVQADDSTARAYGVFGTPVFFLVGKSGTVLWRHVGRLTFDGLDGAFDAALATSLASAQRAFVAVEALQPGSGLLDK